jgi:PadR family transcriptional regulator PadR
VRLADRGLLETTWDTDVPAGRPPRHLYRLTGSGRALATELAAARTAATAARRSGPNGSPDERWQGA